MRHPQSIRRAWLALSITAVLSGLAGPAAAVATRASAAPSCASGTTATFGSGASAPSVCGTQASITPAGASSPVAVNTYLGLQYATAARFKPPVLQQPTGSNVAQTVAGAFCPQADRPNIPTAAQSENCLYLNVFTPNAAVGSSSPLPVLFFIHGGAFVEGSGYMPVGKGNLYDGSYLAATGNMVVVTINYRLGALGFLAIDSAVENASLGGPLQGNFGILDQQQALQWVQQYIGAFGGDPARVTVAGESAGAMSTGLHLFAAPKSAPLFRAAIMESNPVGSVYRALDKAQAMGSDFRGLLCTQMGLKCVSGKPLLLAATAQQILSAQAGKLIPQKGKAVSAVERQTTAVRPLAGLLGEAAPQVRDGLPWSPTQDGTVIAGQPLAGYATASMPAKPFVFGINRDEGAVFANMAYLKLGNTLLNPLMVNQGMLPRVWQGDSAKILAYTVDTQGTKTTPYKAPAASAPSYMNRTAVTLSSIINDFAFRCGNLAMADRAAAANAKASPAQPAFGYLFAQAPLIDLYSSGTPPKPIQACLPGNGNVCHANELPYVFNTIGTAYAAYTQGSKPPPAADQTLATTMAAAWASFVNNPSSPASWAPSGSLPTTWTPYAGTSSPLALWDTAGAGSVAAATIDAEANCTALWNTIAPIAGN
ncbi:carboxylesterase family protein [Paracidovorax anthurii]|uniref:Carboxylic ester hydrolase n=1 Tax=Paracidovorax anthurii TaxID=78229 RepID=A0A328YZX3_9BURK|nr:carboxylesterase family protein [Paracidovorax anthurii]RAR76137.1 para-nitrobenzyl esterase [Paracidovorax anthurii]